MKIVFAGTPEVAVPSLTALAGTDHEIVTVITRADAPLGRKRTLTPSPVALAAAERGYPVLKTNRLDAEATETIRALQPDLGVIVAYGGIVREPLLSVPRLGWINLHFSLLPRWRGASPVQRAVIAGDELIGAAVFQLVPELDAGDVFGSFSRPLGVHSTSGILLDELSHSGAELLLRVVGELAAGTAVAVPQTGEVTLAPKLTRDDARINFDQPAASVYSRIRGVTPEPGAFTTVNGAVLKLLEVAPSGDEPNLPAGTVLQRDTPVLVGTQTEPLVLLRVQPAGKTAMTANDWWRGVAAESVIAL
ncbi:methionyl-tRNA formyltransferase [Cryobacterium levicorallinum]|uniref:Methionyl-tRNA formyltransferase n=1 Tax=Cryobacterium levicorallinum TaxID=995038 RepID=A0A1I3A1R9_9MICO|nr:methionyl-tRNA formyltransferase [Cryobacterium levicorallinum]TFB82715.1 methionyl-tRNA formyltransferase [Cryobacterium levicorallinum]GEP26405.1 methionyl-tRNA formyltransferase [Cryobacterium levicorallinum]SFH43836.1 methionyl-tRNA formyltransferase [Cryobacterium levicorallinum]